MANSIQPIATCTYIFHLRLEMSRCKQECMYKQRMATKPIKQTYIAQLIVF